MTARKTSFTDSPARRLLAIAPLPAGMKNVIRKIYHSRVTPDEAAFNEPGTLNNLPPYWKPVATWARV